MTNSDQLDPDDPEEYDPMAMSRDYHDTPYIIPGLRVRRIKPSRRRHPRRDVEHGVGRVLDAPAPTDLSTRLNGLKTCQTFTGVVRQSDPLAGVLRQKATPADDQVAQGDTLRISATPPEGAEMPLEGVEDLGGTDTQESPLLENSNGVQTGFWRSGDADPRSGAR